MSMHGPGVRHSRWLLIAVLGLLLIGHATVITMAWRSRWFGMTAAIVAGVIALKYAFWRCRR
jgi:hypothetical protein